MEINTQQLEALFHLQEQQAQLPRKTQGQAQGFESLLNSQLAQQAANTASPEALAVMDAHAALGNVALEPANGDSSVIDADEAAIQAAFDQAAGTLDLWDRYARTLGTSPADTALREAWSLLEGIDTQVSQMRANPVANANEALKSILNDLEVLSATEKFKFNRGDYLA